MNDVVTSVHMYGTLNDESPAPSVGFYDPIGIKYEGLNMSRLSRPSLTKLRSIADKERITMK